ncbi:PPOX class F420-dependent oxidoreductase [Streptomyces sp. SL13]|jgi:PPOX class probable F420-dependent enzyme|uniref:PPOX class F420-dependent oxidoreductase n=1 Tax=Streptantibioticus silvisoli TaxID=2705255 RepID=A0AA90H6S8_9ACTN|nr:PPOX class F420-dependent oxidoreductase [Streptantibioticus silvisoli]MDI5966272.1 PPOX class F420-dependent oxidoreductase [Streptantibioticus silvisoli]MDI5971614.1 PPOX class F420-dependent oxidoreductase [Streptantibioticus silvisoli]
MAQAMTDARWREFVTAGTRTGKLSTVTASGAPHVAPVWFLLDGDDLVFNTGADSVKGRNLARDGRAAVCVDDEAPPFAFALLRGTVQLHEDPAQLREWATRIAARYVGDDRAEQFGARNGTPGELLVRLRIEHVVAMEGLTD